MKKNTNFKIDVISGIDEEVLDRVTKKRCELTEKKPVVVVNKRKKLTAIIAIAAAVAVLLSVMAVIIIPLLKPDEVRGTVPIYTGMTVSSANGESLALDLKPLSANGQGFGMMLLDNSNTEGNEGNHGANNPNKKPIEDIVNNSGTLAPTPSEQMYYAKQNEDIIITIHFENPDEYKIMSFKLNGKAYADYMFEYGSDYENIMIKVNVGEALGIIDYTIDAIQYADRDVLKYVEMKGDPTLSIGVYNAKQPAPSVTGEKVGTNSIEFGVNIANADSLVTLSGGKLWAIVADDEQIVDKKELNVGDNEVKFEGLKTGTAYRYAIVAEYDALDGSGYKSYILTEKEFITEEVITIESVTPDFNSVSFNIKWSDVYTGTKTLTALELYTGETKVKDIDINASSVSELISDTEYTLIAKYNNGSEETRSVTFRTKIKIVEYTVNHYVENAENSNYTIKETQKFSSPENTEITPAVKTYLGFKSPANQTVMVKSDVSLVIDYYYSRKTATITFTTNGGAEIPTQTLKYEATITVSDAKREGYTFGGWFTDEKLTKAFDSKKMGMSNVTLYAWWVEEAKPTSFYYSAIGSEITLIKFTGNETELTIPMYIGGKKVVKIGNGNAENSFAWEKTALTAVKIPDSVTSIEEMAFYKCTGLKSVIIPDGVVSISSFAFKDCKGITTITLGKSLVKIEEDAFDGCPIDDIYITNLEGWLTFSNNRYYISFYANKHFLDEGGNEITELVIPKSTTEIGIYAFYGCVGLKSVIIPDTVTNIYTGAFMGCENLTDINIPDSVKSISYAAFQGCRGIKNLTIGNGVTSIEDYAFYGCYDLVNLTIGNSVEIIGNNAFNSCTSLAEITVPDSVTIIGYSAFKDCRKLRSVTIGKGVTGIDQGAFGNCTNIEKVYIKSILNWCKIDFISKDANPIIWAKEIYIDGILVTDLVIPNGVDSIKNYAFYSWDTLESVSVPEGVKSIGKAAFYECVKLEGIIIPDGVISIGTEAFFGCMLFSNITIPDSVKSIGYSAFEGCRNIEEAFIPTVAIPFIPKNKLKKLVITSGDSIVDAAFSGCDELTSLTIGNSVTKIGKEAFKNCSGLVSATIPDSVTVIGNSAFYGCTGLVCVTFGNGLTSISDYTFYGCSGLTSVIIPNNIKSIGKYSFYGCSEIEALTIGEGVINIGNSAFALCSSLESLTIPENVTKLDFGVFQKCSKLKSLTVFGNITYMGSDVFKDCTQLTNVILGDRVALIGSGAFAGCISLTTVTIGNGVKSIDDYAFKDCTSLAQITIPDNVVYMDFGVFSGCTLLNDVTISDGVEDIAYNMFNGCTSLKSITLNNKLKGISNTAFASCTNLTSIKFKGTKEEWEKITKLSGWDKDLGNYIVHCTDGDIVKEST